MSAPAHAGDAFRTIYPFESRFHPIGPHRMHYLDEGAGDAVVLLHGNPTWSFFYRRLVSALRPAHRAIAPDHIGCGLSDKPQKYPYALRTHIDNLGSLLDALRVERFALVVHDWGGPIGMGLAIRRPEAVSKLVILNTAAFLSRRIPFRIDVCRIPVFGAIAVRGFNAFARAALTMAVHHRERMTPEIRAGYLMPYDSWANRIGILRFVQDIPTSPRIPSFAVVDEVESRLSSFRRTPMLIQWGARDWCFDGTFLEGWRRRFPDAAVDAYEDAGHYVLEDAHERVIPRVQDFLRSG